MRILYVVGSCLQRNTSANMSHNSYIQGLLENGHSVDIIMAKDSFGVVDNCFPKFSQAKYFEYDSTPRINFLRDVVKGLLRSNRDNIDKVEQKNIVTEQSVGNNDTSLFKLIKNIQ